jgi:transcriptional regulator with AAA-type ATPase domain
MSLIDSLNHSLLTFADSDTNPLSIRAKALIFVDPRSRAVHQQVEQLAPAGDPILIRGETGTGKELLARHIHRASERSGLFVAVNCAAINAQDAEVEFFGYAAGQRVNASGNRAGWFGSANGGTLYLDEIVDLPLALQAKLLTALTRGSVIRQGALQPTLTEVRLVAASSIDLSYAVKAGRFNAALYQYLKQGQLRLPPLRERTGDILVLAEYFLAIYAQRLVLEVPQISPDAQAALEAYAWPRNIRELENVMHFALLVSSGAILVEHLSLPSRI